MFRLSDKLARLEDRISGRWGKKLDRFFDRLQGKSGSFISRWGCSAGTFTECSSTPSTWGSNLLSTRPAIRWAPFGSSTHSAICWPSLPHRRAFTAVGFILFCLITKKGLHLVFPATSLSGTNAALTFFRWHTRYLRLHVQERTGEDFADGPHLGAVRDASRQAEG